MASLLPEDEVLVRLYQVSPRSCDDLPYTPEFEELFEQYRALTAGLAERHEVWRRLLGLRKRRLLPTKGRS